MNLLPSIHNILSEDSWLRSRTDGRYLLLRGMCFGPSAKLPPYLPFRTRDDWEQYESYVDLLLACGLTTLRLPFLWSAFEPIGNPIAPEYNEEYFQDFFYFIRRFASKGFLIIIDLHQDLVGKAFGGGGMPDWVQSEGSQERSFLRNTPLWGLNYALNRHLRQTFTDFWNNDLTNRSNNPPLEHFKVRDRFLDALERVAKEAATIDRVFGIEIFNEPHPAKINDRHFEEEVLHAFYEDALQRIRKHSPDLFALFSPQSDWNVNVRENKEYVSALRGSSDKRIAFGYHYYDSVLTATSGMHFNDAKRDEYRESQRVGVLQAREKGMVPFLTEFGTRQNWLSSIVRRHMNWQFEAIEQALVHATYWNVNLYNTPKDFDGFMREDFSLIGTGLKLRNLDIATRPYVVAASAEPVHMHFNIRTKEFELVLRGKPVDAPTVIYIPAGSEHPQQPVHYSGGFDIGYAVQRDAQFKNNILELHLDPTRELHEILITPLGANPSPNTLSVRV
jgi:hypothetical protein